MEEKEFLGKNFVCGGTIEHLIEGVGNYNGVYIISLPENFEKLPFNKSSKLEKWRDRKVAVSVEELNQKWIDNVEILYIGNSTSEPVYKRVLKHKAFWSGKSVCAYGGKVIGQMQNWKDLKVWYLRCENSKEIKKALLKTFETKYKKLPFANQIH